MDIITGITDGTTVAGTALDLGTAMGRYSASMVGTLVTTEMCAAEPISNGAITTGSRSVFAGLFIGNVQLGPDAPALSVNLED